ncbi:hypothetical protein VTI28DRAFT_10026 [Corynascus sepedonium]
MVAAGAVADVSLPCSPCRLNAGRQCPWLAGCYHTASFCIPAERVSSLSHAGWGYPINQRLEPAKPSHAISKVSDQRRRKGGLERLVPPSSSQHVSSGWPPRPTPFFCQSLCEDIRRYRGLKLDREIGLPRGLWALRNWLTKIPGPCSQQVNVKPPSVASSCRAKLALSRKGKQPEGKPAASGHAVSYRPSTETPSQVERNCFSSGHFGTGC